MINICIIATIVIYLVGMLLVGFVYSKSNEDSSDFYLGGRTMGPLVTAMSAEASDMSSWLLMGMPGLAYLTGIASPGWTAIGLAVGTWLNWLIVARRLRRYSANLDAITVPQFLSLRFHDQRNLLNALGAVIIIVFFIPYTASGFAACGKLFNSLFGVDYMAAMILSAENSKKIYLNKEIEESWTEEDIELFNKLSFEERVFYADYLSTEFEITKFLVDFAKTNKAVLAGLEYRVKSPKSLYNKLYQRVEKSFFDSIADVIRYTVILEPKEYVEQIRSVTDALYEKNWKIYSLKNYWVNDSFPYNGVNAKFKNSRNYRIEIQFHTQESFDVKMSEEDHKLYEQRRVLEPGCDEYNRILQLQLKLYSDMEYPENIADLEKI